ncbi:MAG: TetR/AcrR family transcriptional regulator [Clostridia bacterium]|nr:TetR/AcrR family transcriptional regulator [Clostridia bacterium]
MDMLGIKNKSQRKLALALLEIMRVKQFEDISISEVCQRAGINRSTFYAHFDNLMDLLEAIQDATIAHLASTIRLSIVDNNSSEDIKNQLIIPYLEVLKENDDFVKSFFNQDVNIWFDDDKNFVELLIRPILAGYDVTEPHRVQYISHFFISGILSIIKLWVSRGYKEPVEEVALILINCYNSRMDDFKK